MSRMDAETTIPSAFPSHGTLLKVGGFAGSCPCLLYRRSQTLHAKLPLVIYDITTCRHPVRYPRPSDLPDLLGSRRLTPFGPSLLRSIKAPALDQGRLLPKWVCDALPTPNKMSRCWETRYSSDTGRQAAPDFLPTGLVQGVPLSLLRRHGNRVFGGDLEYIKIGCS